MTSASWISRHRWTLIVAAAVVGAIAVLAAALFLFDDARNKVGSALVDGALQIAFVGLVGGALTYAIREELDHQSAMLEENRRLNDERLRLLMDVVSAYHRIKSARRTLRSAGFETLSGRRLEPWQIDVYRAQMSELNQAELSVGKIERELRVNPGQLSQLDLINGHVSAVKEYLDEIIEGWEQHAVGVGQGRIEAVKDQGTLTRLLAHDKDRDSFIGGVVEHMDAIEAAIRSQMKEAIPTAGLR